ncbi:hypothetical protein ACNKHN_03380 [Shigella flexneri]
MLELNENDPGILVTRSVHKQRAGFSQTSQIHKRQPYQRATALCTARRRIDNAFIIASSTSRSIRCLPHWISTPKCMKGSAVVILGNQCG